MLFYFFQRSRISTRTRFDRRRKSTILLSLTGRCPPTLRGYFYQTKQIIYIFIINCVCVCVCVFIFSKIPRQHSDPIRSTAKLVVCSCPFAGECLRSRLSSPIVRAVQRVALRARASTPDRQTVTVKQSHGGRVVESSGSVARAAACTRVGTTLADNHPRTRGNRSGFPLRTPLS